MIKALRFEPEGFFTSAHILRALPVGVLETVQHGASDKTGETAADETCVDFFVSAALSCAADWAVIPIQDWLRLGHEARINTPSTLGGNWVWRLRSGSCTKALAKEMKRKTELYERNSVIEP